MSAAAFYKKLKSTVYSQTIPYDFTGYPDPLSGVPAVITTKGTMNTMANGDGGFVKGTELSVALDGSMVSPALTGFGVVGSTSFTSSNIHQANNLDNPLEGLSGRVNSTCCTALSFTLFGISS